MFFTLSLGLSVCVSVCLCVCLCVCHQDCDEMAGLSNTVLSEAITLGNSSALQHYQDDLFPFPNTSNNTNVSVSVSYGPSGQNHILGHNFKTYKWTNQHEILPVCSLARGTAYMLRILRSMGK